MKTKFIDFFFDEDMKNSKYATILYYGICALFIETLLIAIVEIFI